MNWRRQSRLDRWKHWQTWLPSLLATLFVAGLFWLKMLQPLEHLAYQWLFQWRGHLAWDERVVLVKIDEPSLKQLGAFPWSRDRYTQLLNVIKSSQPNTVVFDLVFSELSPADQRFAEAIRQHRQIVIAGAWNQPNRTWQPNPMLRKAAIATGHILQTADADGIVRRIPTYVDRAATLSLPSLQTYQLFANIPEMPLAQSHLWPNWIAPTEQMPQYSFIDLLNGQVTPAALENKIILVGATAAGFNPLMTPFDEESSASGVHLHATLLNNLLQQNLLQPIHGKRWMGLLLLSNLIWSHWLRQVRTFQQLVGSGILVSGWWLLALLALHQSYWLPVAVPGILWLTTSMMHWIMGNIQLEAKNQQLNHLANIDELTQISNRRALEQYLQQEWQRSRREQQPISLLLCDVDFFKQFNDCYGHIAGDECLYQIAQALNLSTKRPTDLIARYGGEEFAVVLPNTDAQGAENLATAILSQVRAKLIPHQKSPISHYVTLSLGLVTVVPDAQIDWLDMIDAADRALYQAKFQGRDRACNAVIKSPTAEFV
ncbi:diguanylate cyclase [filamentous cyanobacterium LEGE 11480]|uniref:Diguanylate cyclase n=1 Tax=Romeriopsis navalis LEGE 11480 TaxID=2777977 RepID=A0A928VLM1_9CYAN|nr:diguanylate cyclase [Romeriopsis navalis]MBE9030868.1 diguanylate cyclase [Romeriopsis navalis LEGE 11480]